MTAVGPAASTGWDENAARAWIEHGTGEDEYRVPWALAVGVIAEEPPAGDLVVLDVASGPGGFLGTALSLLPQARGIWLDNFATMGEAARENLASFGERVEYRVGDLVELTGSVEPATVSAVTCSRATHHLDDAGLGRFYEEAFEVVRPGGWIANLDSMAVPGAWGPRLSGARKAVGTRRRQGGETRDPNHPKGHPHPYEQHVAAAGAAGLVEMQPVWRFCQQVLLLARKPA